jgi:hypothetical protein
MNTKSATVNLAVKCTLIGQGSREASDCGTLCLGYRPVDDGRLISDGVDRHSNFVPEAELMSPPRWAGAGAGHWSLGEISQGGLVLAVAHELGASHVVEYDCYARSASGADSRHDGEVWERVF